MQLWHLYSSLLGLGWAYQFSITDHGNLLHRYENGPPAASRILRTLLPCSSSFWCKWEAALQVQRGGGEPGEMQLREFFVRPDVNLKCSQGWKQNSMSACTGHWGLFNRRTFSHTKASRPFTPNFPNIPPSSCWSPNLHCQKLLQPRRAHSRWSPRLCY